MDAKFRNWPLNEKNYLIRVKKGRSPKEVATFKSFFYKSNAA